MPANRDMFLSRQPGVPLFLLGLCLLALFSSVFGLSLTSTVANNRVADLQASWESVTQDNIDAAEVLTTDRLLRAVATPFPAVESAARWSLAMAALSLILLVWFFIAARKIEKVELSKVYNHERNTLAAMSRLVDEMAPLAAGDLNVEATVQAGTPGALADTFNYAVRQLQQLTGSQLNLTRVLSDAVSNSRVLANRIEDNGSDQSGRILAASNSLLGLNTTTGELATNVADTKVLAKTLAQSADNGSGVLRGMLTRERAVSTSVGQATTYIQSLQEQAQTIYDAMAALELLVQRTDLLALNATLGLPTKHLVENYPQTQPSLNQLLSELPLLAGQLKRSVTDIKSLSQIMLADASDALDSMQELDESMKEYKVDAASLTYSMTDIQQSAVAMQSRTTQLVQKSVQQSSVVGELCVNMELIHRISQQVLRDVTENANSLDSVKKLSNELRQRLPDLKISKRKNMTEGRPLVNVRRAAERAVVNV